MASALCRIPLVKGPHMYSDVNRSKTKPLMWEIQAIGEMATKSCRGGSDYILLKLSSHRINSDWRGSECLIGQRLRNFCISIFPELARSNYTSALSEVVSGAELHVAALRGALPVVLADQM